MPGRRSLTVVVGKSCSLCDTALDHLRLPARLVGLEVVVESLETSVDREKFVTRVPVVLSRSRRVLAEGRIGPAAALLAVLRGRFSLVA